MDVSGYGETSALGDSICRAAADLSYEKPFSRRLTILGSKLSPRRTPLPPGPKPEFYYGNFRHLPTKYPWRTYEKWGREHGPVVYFHALSKKYIVLNTSKAAADLLDARADIYSDRPMYTFVLELVGRKKAVSNSSSVHPHFKKYRKVLATGLNARATKSYANLQTDQLHLLLLNLVKTTEQFISHIQRYGVAVILKLTYGWTLSEGANDPILSVVDEVLNLQRELTRTGRWLVDNYPIRMSLSLLFLHTGSLIMHIVRYVPEWFPFASFQRAARKYKTQFLQIDEFPWNWV
ncbi:uncharacterized protein FIBRA_07912 [Fibroporia radiculosa]|uniref:Cytochrome P450 n=1 Tax=Fibroporia radiculosa TaxID=599839 RepID=J4IC27_9APHY|nr:uncharacterized protein FIBRA_07912 [Fibroporia radiculosa]CCM05681.1 predicted protein [Fibroporia radiculosa]